jgi:hypothetical protein
MFLGQNKFAHPVLDNKRVERQKRGDGTGEKEKQGTFEVEKKRYHCD